MNIFLQQSVQINASSAQPSAAPVGNNGAFLQAHLAANTSKVIKDITIALQLSYVSGHDIR